MESVAVLIIGDEILTAEIADENGPFLLQTLGAAGIPVKRVVTVPDVREIVVRELGNLRALADAVVVSGGIGPTHDDPTRPAVAEALGVELEKHPEAERRILGYSRGTATEAELGMAFLPEGARLLDGEKTGTFGFAVGGIYALPGVPFLFRDIARRLPEEFEARPLHRCVLETKRREGEIAPQLAALQGESLDVAIASYPVHDQSGWRVRVVVRARDEVRAEQVAAAIRSALDELDD